AYETSPGQIEAVVGEGMPKVLEMTYAGKRRSCLGLLVFRAELARRRPVAPGCGAHGTPGRPGGALPRRPRTGTGRAAGRRRLAHSRRCDPVGARQLARRR